MVEVADIFRRHGPEYRQKFQERIPKAHLEAMEAIEQCRTEALGGHVYLCTDCGRLQYSYHSCKNRTCPKCQNEDATRWLEKQEALLLPVPYFMITFTLPEELRDLARSNQKTLYGIMFRASADALKGLARDSKHLGGLIGMVGVLQTWTREMLYHPHIHYLVPGGALSVDETTWLAPRYQRWLVPVKALSKLFRGKLKHLLSKAQLKDKGSRRVWKKPWTVHCEPVGTGREVIKYLAPYIRRIAIANSRIKKLEDGNVTFQIRKGNSKTCEDRTITAEEFIRRFLQHVLPKGFQKVRYYGFLSPTCREQLDRIRTILGPDPTQDSPKLEFQELPRQESPSCESGKLRCTECGGPLVHLRQIPPKVREPPRKQ